MKGFMETYIAQVNTINHLMMRTELLPQAGQDMIDRIRQRSEQVYLLLKKNNVIVQQEIMPLLAPEVILTAEQCEELNDFAEALCTFSEYIDAALAYLIHRKLLKCAKDSGDVDGIIKHQYDLGICSYLLYSSYEMYQSIHIRQNVAPWFEKNAAYLEHFEELSHASRMYVLRSVNNQALVFNHKQYTQVDNYMQKIHYIHSVFTSNRIRAAEPGLSWNVFLCAVYRNCLRISDALEHGYGLQYTDDVQQAAAWLTGDGDDPDAADLDQYSAIELEYILHHLTNEQALEKVNEIYSRRNPQLFDNTGIDQNINIPSFSLLYEARLQPPDMKRINDKIEAVTSYVNAFHRKTGLYTYNYAVVNFINYYPDLPGITPFRHILERLLLAMHVPTYVHSHMVSTLSTVIGKTLLDTAPECFIGFPAKRKTRLLETVEEVKAHRHEIIEFIRYAGLFHDVGKFSCIDVITQYSRRLFDDEFAIIKLHAECGYEILSAHPSTAAYAEVALMHHITYDRVGGYAMEFLPEQERVPVVSDIIRIADAMDAATDNIGRCYSACKTQEAIMEELINSPSSYNPVIMAVLQSDLSQQAIHHVLEDVRSKIYVKVYTFDPDGKGEDHTEVPALTPDMA